MAESDDPGWRRRPGPDRDQDVPWSVFEQFVEDVNYELARLWARVRTLQDDLGPTTIRFQLGGNMPGQITVDTTNETATIAFVDDHGNPTAEPAGAAFTYASDNEAVATVAPDAANPLQADITPVGLGTANISATSNGTALEADGVTAIADPAPVEVTVSAGPAAGESFVLSQ